MHNSQYWDKRALDKYDFVEKQSEAYMDRIKSIYTHAFREIDKDIHRIYTNYLKDLKNKPELNEIDVQKLKELLTKSETEKTWKELKQKGLDKYIQDNYKTRISRLEQIQAQIYSKIKMISYKENETATEMYKGVINDSYYKTMFDIQQGFNQDFEFSRLDNNLINTVLDNKWSGKNYSQRIWKNTDILAEKVSDIVGGGLIRGQSIEKMSRQLREQFNAGKYYADRLARTEMCHFYNEADRMAYEELGVDKYVFMAVLDHRTSEYCQEMDNKIINYKDIKVGENFPPLHPNCRSTTRGYIEGFEDSIKRRARNPITGENEVIDNISYKEWYDNYVKFDKSYNIWYNHNINNYGAYRNKTFEEQERTNKQLYAQIRARKYDCIHIAKNTGYKLKNIERIKQYLFYDRHILDTGYKQFDPSHEIAVSWFRLTIGEKIQKHDITLLKHEFMESILEKKGYNYIEAHKKANKRYNYIEDLLNDRNNEQNKKHKN